MEHKTEISNDPRRQERRPSDTVGSRPTMSDQVGRGRTLSDKRRDEHSLTSLEIQRLFESSGIPRSQRSIERYCRDGKLDCFRDPDEDRYYVTPASAETLIGQLKEIQARHAPAGASSTPPLTADTPSSARGTGDASTADELESLRRENMDLKITNRAKDYFIEQLKGDRERLAQDFKGLVVEFGETKREVGELKAQIRMLRAPNETDRIRGGKEVTGDVDETAAAA